jgi:hypothetical protein
MKQLSPSINYDDTDYGIDDAQRSTLKQRRAPVRLSRPIEFDIGDGKCDDLR